MDISDKTAVTIPLRNLIALIGFTIVSVTGYVNMTSRIASLENGQNIRDVEIGMNSEFESSGREGNWELCRMTPSRIFDCNILRKTSRNWSEQLSD